MHEPLHIEMLRITQQNQILDIQMAYDVILVILFIYRKPGEHFPAESVHDIVIGGGGGDTGHVDSGHHDITRERISEIKDVVNDFLLAVFDDTVLAADFDIGFQFTFGKSGFLVQVNAEQSHDSGGQMINQEDDGGQEEHQRADNRCVLHGNLLRADP